MVDDEREVVFVLHKRTSEGTGVEANLLCCVCASLDGAQKMAAYMAHEDDGVSLTWTQEARTQWVSVVNLEVSYTISEQHVFD